MFQCKFSLNDQSLSIFEVQDANGNLQFPAFSGYGPHINKRVSACVKDGGPIPPGSYYILDRQSGGALGWLRDLFTDRSIWFALYAADGEIDDKTLCEQITRGQFRLHPRGPRGISQGCITVDKLEDFHKISLMLRSKPAKLIEGNELSAYGVIEVV